MASTVFTGTATGHKDLLAKIRAHLTNASLGTQVWSVLGSSSAAEDPLYLKGPGLSGADEIYVNFRTVTDVGRDMYNWEIAGAVAYVPGAWVPRTNQDGGLAEAAAKLSKGQISTAVKTTSGDGYYYVRLIDSNDAQVQYEYIHVPLRAFDTKLAAVEKDGKFTSYIKLEEPATNQE